MFKLRSDYKPTGDQPQAIEKLVKNIQDKHQHQVLLGVTGSGKTFTMANVIAAVNRPTLVISHNKTLAGQLYQEYRDFFPENSVNYFVSYYDYYQPEAYIPQTDTYIEKEAEINDLIDKLRLSATTNLITRKDVIVVASVSCIYNIGAPEEYQRNIVNLAVGQKIPTRKLMENLVALQYQRSDMEFSRGTFRIRGDELHLWLAYEDQALRIVLKEEIIDGIEWIDPTSGQNSKINPPVGGPISKIAIYPAKHYITDPAKYKDVFAQIQKDLKARANLLEQAGKTFEAHRLVQKVNYDLEMLKEVGYINGIENYSRYFDGRQPGEKPHTLLDYFRHCDEDYLTVIDESHMTVPQIRGMYEGDKSRKQTLIEYGFRLPSALDNRPLKFDEFEELSGQTIYTSATPTDWEMTEANRSHSEARQLAGRGNPFATQIATSQTCFDARRAPRNDRNKNGVIEQLIRPTGLIDPEIEVRPSNNQIPDLVIEILKRKAKKERVLVTTLTKKTAEALTDYLNDKEKLGKIIKQYVKENASLDPSSVKDSFLRMTDKPSVVYLHSDVHTLDRQDILDQLRSGEVDVVVGINLLREGLDLPEVSLVAILDADQEGFLRSKTSLIQTMGRAARHINGKVIMYGKTITKSMQATIDEVGRRRKVQIEYNLKNNIQPKGIIKPIRKKMVDRPEEIETNIYLPAEIMKKYEVDSFEKLEIEGITPEDRKKLVRHLTKEMLRAADELNFELAAKLRDKIKEIK